MKRPSASAVANNSRARTRSTSRSEAERRMIGFGDLAMQSVLDAPHLRIKCGTCGNAFLRVPKSQGDQVVCIPCRAVGDYEQVINDPSAGLRGGSLTAQECDDILDYLRGL